MFYVNCKLCPSAPLQEGRDEFDIASTVRVSLAGAGHVVVLGVACLKLFSGIISLYYFFEFHYVNLWIQYRYYRYSTVLLSI